MLQINKKIFIEQGKALSVAKKDVKCLVVANPANTNAKVLSHYAKDIDPRNITCLSRLDHNRAIGQVSLKAGCERTEVEGICIFGNHSSTQYPCINHIRIKGKAGELEKDWLESEFIPRVQKRGGEILSVKGTSSVFSAANAVVDHLRDWFGGSTRIVSMGVVSEGDYGIPEGVFSSFPVHCYPNFSYKVVKDFPISEFCRVQIAKTVEEL